MNEIRKRKIEKEILRTLGTLVVSDKVKDPRVNLVTFHRVELSNDLSIATVYYTAYCTNRERKKLIAGLVSASGFFRSALNQRLKLRRTPELRFVWDSAFIKALEVNQQIDHLASSTEMQPQESDLDRKNEEG